MKKIILILTVLALVLIGLDVHYRKKSYDQGLIEGSKQKSRQIGSVAEQCSRLNGTTVLINKEGGLEITCLPEISASITFPGCATQSATFKQDPVEPIFKQ